MSKTEMPLAAMHLAVSELPSARIVATSVALAQGAMGGGVEHRVGVGHLDGGRDVPGSQSC